MPLDSKICQKLGKRRKNREKKKEKLGDLEKRGQNWQKEKIRELIGEKTHQGRFFQVAPPDM